MTVVTPAFELSTLQEQFLDVVPKNGSTIGNARARQRLKWDEERYWAIRDELVDAGLIRRGPGRGGTVARVLTGKAEPELTVTVPVDNPEEAASRAAEAVQREESLYDPIAATIKGAWSRDHRANLLAAEVVARQGRRATGGTWSRPDIVTIEVLNLLYVPNKILEVVTFEVKPADSINVQCVYEALAHRRSATHAYVVLHVPTTNSYSSEGIDDIVAVARMHGVGVIVFSDPENYETWDELAPAERVEPDPERLNSFIETQLSAKTRDRLAKALR